MGAIEGVGDLRGDSVASLDSTDTVSSSPRVLSLDMSVGTPGTYMYTYTGHDNMHVHTFKAQCNT